ncbi:MAG: 4-hydroxyphenylacetate 3-hydroxylase N-terminal domain-containing protein [Actinomycetota bacterium]|nr:4-hydroxyphenylacetate 3-hydroxylase N-terminal domain-containing protein [Actinomycetota bacterium]
MLAPSLNSMKLTYAVSHRPEWQAKSTLLDGEPISLWTHPYFTKDDMMNKINLERMLGRMTGSCFQRCVGMDMISAMWSATYDVDQAKGTEYHKRFKEWLKQAQANDWAVAGAMSDVKGDRGKRPNQQQDPDMFVHVVDRNKDGIVVRGAKAHITGAALMHELFVVPTQTMRPAEEDYAVSFCVPNNAEGVIHILGRVPSDTRRLESELMDTGNIDYGAGAHETLIIFDDVFVPWERVFLCGETEHSLDAVWRFASYHRENGCKAGVFDTLVGATALAAEYNGLAQTGHIKDKLSDMLIQTEAIYACSIAAAALGREHPSGVCLSNPIYTSCMKNIGSKWVYEMVNNAHDICGGLLVTMPSEKDLRHPEVGKYVEKYLKGVAEVDTEDRMKIFRYIENLTMGPIQVEICVGAGPSQAERMVIRNVVPIEEYKELARKLAKIKND